VAVGLVPEFGYDESDDELAIPELCALSWTVYSLPGTPVIDHIELGEAEYALRLAVRSAADALTTIGLGSAGVDVDDPRGLVEQLLESTRHHQVPEPAPSRALRVLENAAHVDAIITVSAGLDTNRHAVVVRGPDRHRRAAAAGRRRAIGENGCAQRDSARRVAELTAASRNGRRRSAADGTARR
jgi:hypothetical protein